MRNMNATTYYYHDDYLGSPRVMTNSTGAVTWRQDYYAFGSDYNGTATGNTHKFTGHLQDGATGQYYAKARYFTTQLGRWSQPEPLLCNDVPLHGFLSNPQKLNPYSYCYNNPLKMVDLDGLLTVHIWDYQGKNVGWGHASITLDNGTHISWWPSAENREPSLPKIINRIIPVLSNIYSVEAISNQTFANDVEGENGHQPDFQITLTNLDETKIEEWWETFKSTHQWSTLSQNCSTTAADALRAGGGAELVSWFTSHHIIWKPTDVKNFVESIQRKENNTSAEGAHRGTVYLNATTDNPYLYWYNSN